ncbi:MAG TPA: rRNA maturation RNase YbeY [Patescibacteria group bacterium]|jgi:probable rRNA maturation factor
MTEIDVHGDALDGSEVRELVGSIVAAEQARVAKVSVSFTDEPTIRDLNRRHRAKDKATDVLSYPFDGSFPQGSGGEVVICPAVVERLAREDGRDFRQALRETVVHGVLHLLGHEDGTDAGAREMDRRTRLILEEA